MSNKRKTDIKHNGSVPTADGSVSAEHNKPVISVEPLNDDQQHALLAHHAVSYGKLLESKKRADSLLKNGVKLAKAEGVSLDAIKEYIDFQTEEGQERLREEIERKHKIARWAGLSVANQLDFFQEDRTPIDEEAFNDGKRSGLKGEKCEPPHHFSGQLVQKWTEGWHFGQEVLAQRGIKKTKPKKSEGEKDLRPGFLKNKDGEQTDGAGDAAE